MSSTNPVDEEYDTTDAESTISSNGDLDLFQEKPLACSSEISSYIRAQESDMFNLQKAQGPPSARKLPETYHILLVGDQGVGKDAILLLWSLKYPVNGISTRHWFQGQEPNCRPDQPRKRFTVMTTDEKHWRDYPVPDLVVFCYYYGSQDSLLNVIGHHRLVRHAWPTFRQKSQVALLGMAKSTVRLPPLEYHLCDNLDQCGAYEEGTHQQHMSSFSDILRVDMRGILPHIKDEHARNMWHQAINHLMVLACNAFHWRPKGYNLSLRQDGPPWATDYTVECGHPQNNLPMVTDPIEQASTRRRTMVAFLVLLRRICPTANSLSLERLLTIVSRAYSDTISSDFSPMNPAHQLKKLLLENEEIPLEEARSLQDMSKVLRYADSMLRFAHEKDYFRPVYGFSFFVVPRMPHPAFTVPRKGSRAVRIAESSTSVVLPTEKVFEWPVVGIQSEVLSELRNSQWYSPHQLAAPNHKQHPMPIFSGYTKDDPYMSWNCRWEMDALFKVKKPWYED